LVDRLAGGLVVLVVALEDVAAAREDLAVLRDTEVGTRQRPAHGARAVPAGRGLRDHARALGHAVVLVDLEAEAPEPLRDERRERRRAGGRANAVGEAE